VPRLQAKRFDSPDDVRSHPNFRVRTVGFDDIRVGYCAFDPGWRWSTDVAPLLGASSCRIRHLGYSISGTVHVEMANGQELDIGPDTVFEIPPDHDKWVVGDEPWITVEWGGSARAMEAALGDAGNRVLGTVLFTDIVGSTATLQRIGDGAWAELLAAHNAQLREEISVFRGREVKTTGDGMLVLFDSPTRAVRCAAAILEGAAGSGLSVRVGVNSGEVQVVGDDIRGIAVHAASRLMDLAGPNEAMVSHTTRDLVEGVDLELEEAGSVELRGLQGARQVYRLRTGAAGTA
jgi:class 3 adenylate cyclase